MSYFGVSLRNGVGLGLGTVPSLTNTPLSYRLAPSLDLSFAGSDTLSPLITFSRTTNATLTNSAGLVANAPMNLLTYSEQFDNSVWSKTAATVTANAIEAPNGTLTADKLVENTANTDHRIVASANITVGAVYTASIYLKAGERTSVRMYTNIQGGYKVVTINLVNGTFSSSTLQNAPVIADVGGGWWRVSYTQTADTATVTPLYIVLVNGANQEIYTGDGVSGVFLWGSQLEASSTATTYSPTTVKNLLGYTEHFDNAAWTKSNASISATKVDDIYGQPFAQKLVASATTSTHFTSGDANVVSGTKYTASIYVKAAEYSTAIIGFLASTGFSTTTSVLVNLTEGTVSAGVGTPLFSTITNVGNGWYRVSVVLAASASGAGSIYVAAVNGTTYADRTVAGDGTSGIYIFGAQLSDSASVDPYVYNPVAAPSAAAYYGPRFDYDPVTLTPKGLLIEEQRTNRTLYSEDFTGLAWAAAVTGTSTRVNNGAPLGFTRGLITATSANGGIRQIHSGLTSGQVYALSFYIQSTATSVSLTFENGTAGFGSAHAATLNPAAGTFVVGTGFTNVSVQPFGAGYVYTLITAAAGGALAANIEWRITNSGDSVQLGRPQFEAGAFATSYIPTAASQVTRAADSASIIGNNFARWYTQGSGTIFSQFDTPASENRPVVSIDDNTANNMIRLRTEATDPYFRVVTGGAAQADLDVGTVAANTIYKMAGGFGSNSFLSCINAGTVGSDTSGTVPTVDRLRIGSDQAGAYLNGHIARTTYYGRVLTATEDQGITS